MKEKIFVGTMHKWLKEQLVNSNSESNFSPRFHVIFNYYQRKICENVRKIYSRTEILFQSDKNPFKRYLPISLIPPSN